MIIRGTYSAFSLSPWSRSPYYDVDTTDFKHMTRMSNNVLDVRIWDVSHGSAAYMRAGNKDVVLDCGANKNPQFSPLRWLTHSYYGLSTIDYLIISHPHKDHIEDLDTMKELGLKGNDLILQRPKQATELVEENLEEARDRGDEEFIEDAEYYLNVLDEFDNTPDVLPSEPQWALDLDRNSRVRADGGIPYQGVTFHTWGTGKFIGSDNYEKLNNLSRMTVTDAFGFRMVSAGDLLTGGIKEIKNKPQAMNVIMNADVLIAPHHGRESSFDREFVEHINPDLVVFSDKNAENTVSGKYGKIANGKWVSYEYTRGGETRKVVSTNSDGRVRIQANNENDWSVSVSGRGYTSNKANSRRYQEVR